MAEIRKKMDSERQETESLRRSESFGRCARERRRRHQNLYKISLVWAGLSGLRQLRQQKLDDHRRAGTKSATVALR